jgi:hypothetical protein
MNCFIIALALLFSLANELNLNLSRELSGPLMGYID